MAFLGINTGISGSIFRTQNNMDLTSSLLQRSLERIETGNRINRASDDPVGFAKALDLLNDQQSAEIQVSDNQEHIENVDDIDSRLTQILGSLAEMKDLATQKASATGSALATINAQLTDLADSIDGLAAGLATGYNVFGGDVDIDWGTDAAQSTQIGQISSVTGLTSGSTVTDINTAICNAMVGAGQVGVMKENVLASAQSMLTSQIQGFVDHANSIMKVDEAEESAKVTTLQSRQQALVASLQVQNAFAASTVNFLA